MEIAIFAVSHSANLGDGVISESLANAIKRVHPSAVCLPIDLAGRTKYGERTMWSRQAALRLLQLMPAQLSRSLVRRRVRSQVDRLAPVWRALTAQSDAIIIGGGQLFSDLDLNFPTKLAAVAELARDRSLPVAIYGVGVTDGWSAPGRALFSAVGDTDLRFIGVRDARSLEAWTAQYDGVRRVNPILTPDAGLLASDCYGPFPPANKVGLGITAPDLLSYHADSEIAGARNGLMRFFPGVAAKIAETGTRVELFCNGAEEDWRYLNRVAQNPTVAKLVEYGRISIAGRPRSPAELVSNIGSYDAVVAHRLHACVVAHAYQRPCVGLSWDKKVESFLHSVRRGRFMVSPPNDSPDAVCEMLHDSGRTPISAVEHQAALDKVRHTISLMVERLGLIADEERQRMGDHVKLAAGSRRKN